MKNARADLNKLLGGLLLFCVGSALFYVQKDNNAVVDSADASVDAAGSVTAGGATENDLTADEVLKELTIQIKARDLHGIANIIAQLPVAKARKVLGAIIEDAKNELSRKEKFTVVFLVAQSYIKNAEHALMLNFIIEHPTVFQEFSPIYFAAAHGYAEFIPLIVQWAEEKKNLNKNLPLMVDRAVYEGLRTAIRENNVQALKVIFDQKVTISKQQATDLLWQVVDGVHKSEFVQLLIDHGADIRSVRSGYSLLAKATELRSLSLVQALAQANPKPDVNAVYDPTIGTALQIAIQKGFVEIDEYLRTQGARE